MLRLVWKILSGNSQAEASDMKLLQEKLRRMEEDLRDSSDVNTTLHNETSQEPRVYDVVEPTNCFKKTGRVTAMRGDHFIIDQLYFVPKTMLKNCVSSERIEENSRLSFLAYRKHDEASGESTVKVVKILSLIDEMWTENGIAVDESNWTEQNAKPTSGKDTVYYKRTQRREPGKVIEKDGNVIVIETDIGAPINVDMDKIRMSFVPVLGDYVTLDCYVQMDSEYVDFKGEVLEVIAIEPSRTVNGSGKISTIDTNGGEIFTLSGKYVYQADVLAGSYRPSVGDTVTFIAIENEHVQMRCLSVKYVEGSKIVAREPDRTNATVPAPNSTSQSENDKPKPSNGTKIAGREGTKEETQIWSDKQGIKIIGDFEVQLKGTSESTVCKITVRNESRKRHRILQVKPMKTIQQPIVNLKSPVANAQLVLFPGDREEYVFSITGDSFPGWHREGWVWMFAGNFQIGRTFNINIGDNGHQLSDISGATENPQNPASNARLRQLQQKLAALNMRREMKTARIIPGQRISKPPNFVAFKIPMYTVPSELFELVLGAENRHQLREALGKPPYCLDEPLSIRNYTRLFGHWIFLEEINQYISFRKFDMERAHFIPVENFLALHMPNIAETRPSVMLGDTVNATAPWCKEDDKEVPTYQGVIHKVQQNRVLLKFNSNFQSRYNGESYRITFSYGRGPYRKQQHAITRVRATMGMEYLFPEKIAAREPALNVRLNDSEELVLENADGTPGEVLPWRNPNLNHYQKAAIMNVLRGEARPLPYIIFGPPGTGKTITTIELIHQLALNSPDSRLIVATPSNSAAYLITERLAVAGVLKPGDFIRLVSTNQVERESIPEHLAPFCATVDISEERNSSGETLVTESGLRMKCQAKHIGRHRVTISTCSGIGVLMQLRFARNHFTHVIIDEAGQSSEPEVLIPISLINQTVGSVTLVGDPKQLGPTILSFEGKAYGYDIPLLERLLNTARPYSIDRDRFPDTHGYNPRLVTKLCINYRSIPSVLKLYSDIFYDSQLVPKQKTLSIEDTMLLATLQGILRITRPIVNHGFFFCGIDGTNLQTPDSPSWLNAPEANMVHSIVEKLYRKGYQPSDIGIITPYVKQAKIIRRIFDTASLEAPKTGSVEEFQGQERRIVIVSTVRSSRTLVVRDKDSLLGFISSPKRVNVALSRAKVALVVVGNPKLLAIDHIWIRVLQQAVNNDTYFGFPLPATLLAAIQAGTPLVTAQ
ncbi:probable RNA helicase armi [Anopheles ziemanni]|uniref:probable RNA helicase armi n=1 Tax=Anopheles coustani TaxID=139045 RepID=UPI00265B2AAB|nr:probable RNA helicase armi [Anopheles coustani]XP_058167482.1 probable RNA helicase armi [Anopheles ziemanni]